MFKKTTVFLIKPISVNCEKSFDPFKKKKAGLSVRCHLTELRLVSHSQSRDELDSVFWGGLSFSL